MEGVHQIGIVQDGLGHGYREYGVVSGAIVWAEQLEVLGLGSRMLVDRPDDVAGNGANHCFGVLVLGFAGLVVLVTSGLLQIKQRQ